RPSSADRRQGTEFLYRALLCCLRPPVKSRVTPLPPPSPVPLPNERPKQLPAKEAPGSAAPAGARLRIPVWGTFFLLLLGALYFGKDFLLPVVLAALFAMTIRPLVDTLKRWVLPAP